MTYLDSMCSGCGHPRQESFDVDNFDKYDTTILQCHACADRERTSAAKSRDENFDTSGVYYVVEHRHQED